ncbi:vacuolar atp synthase [Ceraceosorus bombacis]|nr:vacuolar atp synthase [Ceraceosorus bombacis]
MSVAAQAAERQLLALIVDEDTATGLLLAGVGDVAPDGSKNFTIVTPSTPVSEIEASFNTFTNERKDIGILLINQHLAQKIRPIVDKYQQAFPALLEIPSKDHPYDPSKDSILKRVQKLFGE